MKAYPDTKSIYEGAKIMRPRCKHLNFIVLTDASGSDSWPAQSRWYSSQQTI